MLSLLMYKLASTGQKEKDEMAAQHYITKGNVSRFVNFDAFQHEAQRHVSLLRETYFTEVNWFYTMGLEDFSNSIPLAVGLKTVKSFGHDTYAGDSSSYIAGWQDALGWYYVWLLLRNIIDEDDMPEWAVSCYHNVIRRG